MIDVSKRPKGFALNTGSEGDIIAPERGSLDYRRPVQNRRTRTKVIVALSERGPGNVPRGFFLIRAHRERAFPFRIIALRRLAKFEIDRIPYEIRDTR